MNEPLTEFEYFQAVMIVAEGLSMSFIALTTIFFAYVALSHFAGKDLPRNVAISISALYSVMSIQMIFNWWMVLTTQFEICFLYAEYYPGTVLAPACSIEPPASGIPLLRIVSTVPIVICWIGSIWYMHRYIRRNDNSADT